MIKGVNRQVVEVAQPECVYFEKVLFFVKPEFSSVSEEKLKTRADALIKNASSPPDLKKSKRAKTDIKQLLKMAGAAGVGAAAVGLLSFFL